MLFDVHLGIHALHRDKMTTLGEDAGIGIQINLFVCIPKNEVHLTILDALASTHLTIC